MKRLFVNIALMLFGVFLSLAFAEGAVRIFYPHARDHVIPSHLFVIDDSLGWTLAPSKHSVHATRYFDVSYTTNSFGFRDRSRSTTKKDDVYRILLYGDSLIFGWGIKDSERFSDLIEDEGSGLEIWNHGVPGWGLDQEVVLDEKEGAALNANAVMFFVGASTLSRIHTGYVYAKYKPMFIAQQDGTVTLIPVPKEQNAALSFFYKLLSPFYLPYFLESKIAVLQEAAILHATGGGERALPTPLESTRLVDNLTKQMLRVALDTAHRRGQQMSILVANLSQTDRSNLRKFCSETGIEDLEISSDILATSAADENSDLIFGKYDKHWNDKANRLIAAQILPQLKQLQAAATGPRTLRNWMP
jgi:hypothetical protein